MKKHHFIHRSPRAITLIELLVVVAILSLLSVFVLPAINGNRENTANRSAAQQVSSLISQARNEAIAVGRPGGITVLANELDITRCRVPPPYRGDVNNATLTFNQTTFGNRNVTGPMPVASLLGLTPFDPSDLYSANRVRVQVDDLISFNGERVRYRIVPFHNSSSPPFVSQNGFRISPVGSTLTTPWPPTGVPLAFAIERQPRIVGTPISLENESSIDMRWSGYGGLGSYTEFWDGTVGSGPPSLAVVFNETGVLNELVVDGDRTLPEGAVFLLVGRVDRRGGSYNAAAGPAANDDTIGTNWQYPTSYWIGIDPASGQVRIAECAPIELPGDGLDNDGDGVVDELIEIPNDGIDNDGDSVVDELQEVVSSQRWVRAALVTQGL